MIDTALVVGDDGLALSPNAAAALVKYEQTIKVLTEERDNLKEIIKNAMRENGILSLKTGDVSVSYVAEGEREFFDSKALREKYPDIYDEFATLRPYKDSVRIKVK